MASQASIVPTDRQDEAIPNSSKTINTDTARTPTETKLESAGSDSNKPGTDAAKRSVKKGSCAVKNHRRRDKSKAGKKSKKGANDCLSDEEDDSSDESDSSDSEGDSDDDDDEEQAKSVTKQSGTKKKHVAIQQRKDTKKTSGHPKSDFKKEKTKSKKKQKNSSKKSKRGKSQETSDSDSSDSDSSDSEIGDDADDKSKESSSKVLKTEMQELQLQVTQLQQQVAQSNQTPQFPATTLGFPLAYPLVASQTAAPPPPPAAPSPPKTRPPPPKTSGRRGVGRGGWRGINRAPGYTGADATQSNADEGSSDEKDNKSKKNSKAEYKRVDWVWDDSIHNYRLQDTAKSDADAQYNDFIFHVRRTFDWEGKYRETIIDIRSKLLRECLQEVIGTIEGVSLVDEIPKLDPNLLFLYLEDLRKHIKTLKKTEPSGDSKSSRKKDEKRIATKRKHVKVLVKYLDHDYAHIKESLYPMLDSGLITFELLWALWKPNTLAYSPTYGTASEPRVFKVEMAQLHSSIMKGRFYYVDGKYFEFDGKRFGFGNLSEEIAEFQGARKITSLACFPLKYRHDEEQVRKDLIERGKKFVSLNGVHYKSYQGIAFMKRKKTVVKFNIQKSRIMIDPAIFRRINPNYSVSTVRPQDHDIIADEDLYSSDDDDGACCCECESGDEEGGEEKVKYVTKVFKAPDGSVCMQRIRADELTDEEDEETLEALPNKQKKSEGAKNEDDSEDKKPEFSDEEYLIASPVVLGFAFSDKQWLEFPVSGVQDIKWNENAWDSLVLEDGTKDLIKALVESRKYHAATTIDDVIQGKGKGLVTVLHGPPGTGKTLTAEGISELLKCPLYMASAGELGTDSRFLEAELQKILDICHAWGAILLLDEADVFLEKRNMHDIHRNALVSIFLRQLEYFQGILFLTTNRVETFDEAFQSRIHIALRYENLDGKAKRAIFQMFLDRVQKLGKIEVKALTEEDLHFLSQRELNGREIKNVVGSAQDLAVNKGEALSMRHIKQVLNVHAKFGRDLKGGTGYEDAMRSYF